MQLNSNHTGNTRFAANQMSTSGSVTDMQLAVQSSFGAKHAVVVTNDRQRRIARARRSRVGSAREARAR